MSQIIINIHSGMSEIIKHLIQSILILLFGISLTLKLETSTLVAGGKNKVKRSGKARVSFQVTFAYRICRTPVSSCLIRESWVETRTPSFLHRIVGTGLPVATQLSTKVPSTATVWFTGPCRMTGGGRSAITVGRNDRKYISATGSNFLTMEATAVALGFETSN